jgi:hypothetical protein
VADLQDIFPHQVRIGLVNHLQAGRERTVSNRSDQYFLSKLEGQAPCRPLLTQVTSSASQFCPENVVNYIFFFWTAQQGLDNILLLAASMKQCITTEFCCYIGTLYAVTAEPG